MASRYELQQLSLALGSSRPTMRLLTPSACCLSDVCYPLEHSLTPCLPCRLSNKPVAQKRVAITVFSFPPDKGNVGTAAYLNVFGSIYRVLQDLQADGYDIGGPMPADETALMNLVRAAVQQLGLQTPAGILSVHTWNLPPVC